jgi:CheY-like chemotaxis protein
LISRITLKKANLTKDKFSGVSNLDILVAAEEAESLRFYKLLLEDWGYSIVTSQDGDECLDVYRKKLKSKKRFDLVILDYRLPKKNGMEVAKEMVALVTKQKILMLTTYEGLIDPKEKPDNLKTIEKPFGVQELQVMIRELTMF